MGGDNRYFSLIVTSKSSSRLTYCNQWLVGRPIRTSCEPWEQPPAAGSILAHLQLHGQPFGRRIGPGAFMNQVVALVPEGCTSAG